MKPINETVVDSFVLYTFIKKITTPFDQWEAYKLGIIDKNGKVIKKRSTFTEYSQKTAFTAFDLLICNIKKLIEKLPGGKARLASYLAGLFLIKEENNLKYYYDEDNLYEAFTDFYRDYSQKTNILNESVEFFIKLDESPVKKLIDKYSIKTENQDFLSIELGYFFESRYYSDEKSTLDLVIHNLKTDPAFYNNVAEDVAANSVGAGGIAGLRGDPVVRKLPSVKKRKKFKDFTNS